VTELLAHTRPEVGDFSVGPGGASSGGDSGSSSDGEWGKGAGGGEGGQGAAAGLPLPWPAGSEAVRLVGVVALRRR
jgi:hypothetical protein